MYINLVIRTGVFEPGMLYSLYMAHSALKVKAMEFNKPTLVKYSVVLATLPDGATDLLEDSGTATAWVARFCRWFNIDSTAPLPFLFSGYVDGDSTGYVRVNIYVAGEEDIARDFAFRGFGPSGGRLRVDVASREALEALDDPFQAMYDLWTSRAGVPTGRLGSTWPGSYDAEINGECLNIGLLPN